MPTVVVETGSLVAGANSFVTRAEVAAYAENRGYAFTAADALLDGAVIRAGDYLKNETRFVYRGARRTATQTMPWPREGASYYRGPDIPNDNIPQCLKDAQCELAYRSLAGTNLQPDLSRGGRIKRQRVDVIEREFFDDAPSETTILAVLGILAPILTSSGAITDPYQANPTVKTPFQPDEFNNPPTTYVTDPVAES